MRDTRLVVMHASLTGWLDTGSTTMASSVARYRYRPDGAKGTHLTEREEILGYNAELFLTESVEQDISMRLVKAFSEYSTAMALP